jgi:hypothetical protein
MLSTALLLAASVVVGQAEETSSPSDHLECFGQFIGKWVYKGPIKEDAPAMAEKGTEIVVHISWEQEFGGNVIESEWEASATGRHIGAGTSLIAWDPRENRIVSGGVDSRGGYRLGVIAFSDDGQTYTRVGEGVDFKGRKTSGTVVITLKDEDTLVWQAMDRTGGDLTGDSPKYTFTRCSCENGEDDDDDD